MHNRSKNFLLNIAFVADASAVNRKDTRTLLAYGLNIFPIKEKSVLSVGLRSLHKIPIYFNI